MQPTPAPQPALGNEEEGRRLEVSKPAPPVPEKQAARRDRRVTPSAPAAAPQPVPPPPAAAESRNVVATAVMDRAEQKSALAADVEVTTISPVSGKEMHYSANKKNVEAL